MDDFRRSFFNVLYEEFDGLPNGWSIKERTVNEDFVDFNPIQIRTRGGNIAYKVLVQFENEKITVIQAIAEGEINNKETVFQDPEKAAIFVLGSLTSSGVLSSYTEQSEESGEEDDPLSELFD